MNPIRIRHLLIITAASALLAAAFTWKVAQERYRRDLHRRSQVTRRNTVDVIREMRHEGASNE